jgi:hypothetical protein
MNQNRLGIAIVVLLALGGLTFYRLSAREAQDKPAPQTTLTLPKIKRDSIDELLLSGGDDPGVRLVKKGAEWRLAEPLDAKADQDTVGTALDKLAELEMTGVAATKAKNHERLEVDEKKGLHVIAKGAGKTLIDGYIGAYHTGNSMFRPQGQVSVASVRGSIRYAFAKAIREWRDRTISKIESKDVEEIGFSSKNGNLRFVRQGESWKQVVGKGDTAIPTVDEPKVLGVVNSATAMSATDFADPKMTIEQAGLGQSAATVTLKMKGNPAPAPVVYRIGAETNKNYYFQRDGADTIFIVSSWVGERLMPKAEAFTYKKEEVAPPQAPEARNNAPEGSPENPIKVFPTRVEKGAHGATAKAAASAPKK